MNSDLRLHGCPSWTRRLHIPLLAAGLLLSAMASGPTSAAPAPEIPEALSRVVASFPSQAGAVAYIRIDRGLQDALFEALPFGESYRKVFEEQADRFAQKTGFDPSKNIKGLAAAFKFPEDGAPTPSILLHLELDGPVDRMLEALQKDPVGHPKLKFEGPGKGTVGEFGFRRYEGGLMIGTPAIVEKLPKKARTSSKTPSLLAIAADSVDGPARALVASRFQHGKASEGATGPQALLRQMEEIGLGMTEKEWGIRAKFSTEQGGQAIAQMIQMLLRMSLAGMEQKANAAAAADDSVLGLISPEVLGARASFIGGKRVVDALKVTPKGPYTTLRIARDALPSMGSTGAIALIGVASAIAIPNFRAARLKANRRACFANQKVIAGATEKYNLEHNTNIKKLDRPFLEKLQKEGYLQNIPDDPGQGDGSWANWYFTDESSNGIACKVHGSIDGTIKGTLQIPDPRAAPAAGLGQLLKRFTSGAGGQ